MRKQRRIDNWNANPKLCRYCQAPLTYEQRRNDYCDQSCSAKLLNLSRGHTLAEDKVYKCLFCASEFEVKGNGEHKYCSRECMMSSWWEDTKNEISLSGTDNSSANRTGKKYLIELHSGKCQICGGSEWQGQKMPLVIDHISGNPYDNS
jgi:hypothetical protein